MPENKVNIKIKIELECELEIDGWVVLRILMDHLNAHMHWNFISLYFLLR